jgi:hypothetical protein
MTFENPSANNFSNVEQSIRKLQSFYIVGFIPRVTVGEATKLPLPCSSCHVG